MSHSDAAQHRSYQAAWMRAYRAANPEKVAATALAWRKKHRERLNASARNRRRQNKEGHRQTRRKSHLRSKYGLTPQTHDVLLGKQEGLCAICTTLLTPGRGTNVDHDHATGFVRALLCKRCNLVLGHARDEARMLRKAADYLESHGCAA